MDNVISFTPAQLIAAILAICAAIVTISAAIGVIVKIITKAREPEELQNKRLDDHDKRIGSLEEIAGKFKDYFDNDDKRFKEIERTNKITISALLAILKHSLNGNDIESLKKAEKTIEEYLIDKVKKDP